MTTLEDLPNEVIVMILSELTFTKRNITYELGDDISKHFCVIYLSNINSRFSLLINALRYYYYYANDDIRFYLIIKIINYGLVKSTSKEEIC